MKQRTCTVEHYEGLKKSSLQTTHSVLTLCLAWASFTFAGANWLTPKRCSDESCKAMKRLLIWIIHHRGMQLAACTRSISAVMWLCNKSKEHIIGPMWLIQTETNVPETQLSP